MSKNIDMVGFIDELSSLVQKIKEGTATRGEIEAFASAASELHERAVVLRYKAYELQVFGERSAPAVVQEVSVTEVQDEVESAVVEEAPVAIVSEVAVEEPSFDLFQDETNESIDLFSFDMEEPVAEEIIEEEITPEVPVFESVVEEVVEMEPAISVLETIEEEEIEIAPAIELEETFAVEDEKEEVEEPAHVWATTSEIPMDFEEPSIISEKTWMDAPLESNLTLEPTAEVEEIVSQWESTNSVEEVIETEAVATPEIPSFNSPIHPIYSRLRAEDASFAGRLMAIRLENLKGAFGLNERMQLVQSLFAGSNDAFLAAVDSLDSLANKEESRSYVTTIASRYNWSPDDPLAIEFVQKVERRYA